MLLTRYGVEDSVTNGRVGNRIGSPFLPLVDSVSQSPPAQMIKLVTSQRKSTLYALLESYLWGRRPIWQRSPMGYAVISPQNRTSPRARGFPVAFGSSRAPSEPSKGVEYTWDSKLSMWLEEVPTCWSCLLRCRVTCRLAGTNPSRYQISNGWPD